MLIGKRTNVLVEWARRTGSRGSLAALGEMRVADVMARLAEIREAFGGLNK